jgi:putative addiction module component (TIGR02574 family)
MDPVDRVFTEASHLTPSQRSELVERLLDTIPGEPPSEVEAAWMMEVRARLARIRSGEAKLVPWEEFEHRFRAR